MYAGGSPFPEAGPTDQTMDASSLSPDPAHPCHVQLVEGSGPQLTGETRSLLQSRLRTSALILLMGFGAFWVWSLLRLAMGSPINYGVLAVHTLVVIMLSLCAGALCRKCPITIRKLHLKEVVIFGMPAAFMVWIQYLDMTTSAAAEEPLPNPVGAWLMLIFTYAMFIPNSWRRAAVVIGLIGVLPILLTGILWATNDDCAMCLENLNSFGNTAEARSAQQGSRFVLFK